MSIVHASFLFSLPEDVDSTLLLLSSSATETGTYTAVAALPYVYGTTSIDINIDNISWYRLQFLNPTTGFYGHTSDPVYGGNVSFGAPFLTVSSPTSSAHFATTTDVYQYAGLTAEDIPQAAVGRGLRQARAMIDYRSEMMDITRFEVYPSEVGRRKYNAGLRLLKEAEISYTLGYIYRSMADDTIMQARRGEEDALGGSVSIGGTSVGLDGISDRSENIAFLATLSTRYFEQGEALLATLGANSIRLVGQDYPVRRNPRFTYPLYK